MRAISASADPGDDLPGSAFALQQDIADSIATRELAEPMLLSWYDAGRGIESPNGVSECGHATPDAGVRQYAASRGAALAVELGERPRQSVFCYLDLGEPPPNG